MTNAAFADDASCTDDVRGGRRRPPSGAGPTAVRTVLAACCVLLAASAVVGRGRVPSHVAEAVARAEARRAEVARWPGARGVVIGLFSDGEGDAWKRQLLEAKELGASHVLVVLQHAMADTEAVAIRPLPWLTPSEERLDAALAEARRLGLGVVLMPTIYLEKTGDDDWRGTIRPMSWSTWWNSHRRFVLAHARLAEKHDVEVFVIGSELLSTESQRERWAELVLEVRATTDALLSYSFNWDHLEPGAIHDLVDVVGMNSYFDLSDAAGAPVRRMEERLGTELAPVVEFLGRVNRPILVTEIGYRSVVGGEIDPWDYTVEAEYDGATQARCYEAATRAWDAVPGFRGAFFYWWRGDGGAGDTTYTPRGKPAEAVLRAWLAESARDAGEP